MVEFVTKIENRRMEFRRQHASPKSLGLDGVGQSNELNQNFE